MLMMKKLVLFFILFPFVCFGQLELPEKIEVEKIGEITMAHLFLISLEKLTEPGTYIFRYLNLKHQDVSDITEFYLANEDELNELYQVILDNVEEKKTVIIELDKNKELRLSFKKRRVQFNIWDGSVLSYSAYFSLKQINKLFGKRSTKRRKL
jgi:hypothetical protein